MIGRADIAAALSAVDGLTGYPSRPDNVVAGTAWPEWVSRRWLNQPAGGARANQWRAYVALPNATAGGTIDAADPLIEEVGQALTDLGFRVEAAESWSAAAPGTPEALPALRYTLTE